MIDYNKLLELANVARKNSYAPYSGYNVGAALLTKSGKIYTGCNIENAAFSPSICAERTAIFKAVSEGEREFLAISIVGGQGEDISKTCSPCGVCRQVMAEFFSKDTEIVLGTINDYKVYLLEDILPLSFTNNEL